MSEVMRFDMSAWERCCLVPEAETIAMMEKWPPKRVEIALAHSAKMMARRWASSRLKEANDG